MVSFFVTQYALYTVHIKIKMITIQTFNNTGEANFMADYHIYIHHYYVYFIFLTHATLPTNPNYRTADNNRLTILIKFNKP